MRRARADGWARTIGACLGAGLAVAALASARVPAGAGELGLDLTVAATATGELGVTPPGPAIRVAGMRPGSGAATGTVAVRNQTGRRRALRLRALPSSAEVDRALRVRASAGGAVLYDGELGGMRRWTSRAIELGSGATATLTLRAWLPEGATRWAGRIVDVPLELTTEGAR
ncbi:MAG: hypothetical protein WD844_13085 [Thermoleophilaceae bacterium]